MSFYLAVTILYILDLWSPPGPPQCHIQSLFIVSQQTPDAITTTSRIMGISLSIGSILYCTFRAQYGASHLATHTHLHLTHVQKWSSEIVSWIVPQIRAQYFSLFPGEKWMNSSEQIGSSQHYFLHISCKTPEETIMDEQNKKYCLFPIMAKGEKKVILSQSVSFQAHCSAHSCFSPTSDSSRVQWGISAVNHRCRRGAANGRRRRRVLQRRDWGRAAPLTPLLFGV